MAHQDTFRKGEEMAAFTSKKYSWRGGWNPKIKAEIVGEVFSEIEMRDGSVTSESFLDASRSEDSPTHSIFEWDDSIAAERYRLQQSKTIISQLQIEVVIDDSVDSVKELEVQIEDAPEESIRKVPAYVNVNPYGRFGSSNHTKASYVNLEKVMSDEDMRKTVLENVLNELSVYQRKYFMYQELEEIFDAISSVKKKMGVE